MEPQFSRPTYEAANPINKTFLASLFICNFAANSLYMNVCALLPEYVDLKYSEMTSFQVGCLMSVYPLA